MHAKIKGFPNLNHTFPQGMRINLQFCLLCLLYNFRGLRQNKKFNDGFKRKLAIITHAAPRGNFKIFSKKPQKFDVFLAFFIFQP